MLLLAVVLLLGVITPSLHQDVTTALPCEAPSGWIEAGKEDLSIDEPVGG